MPVNTEEILRRDEGMIAEIISRPKTGRRISEIKDELGTIMNQKLAVYRDEEGLTAAHEVVLRLKEEADAAYIDDAGTVFNQDVLGALELGYMLDCAEATIVSAIERKESRGAQFRTDYPERDDDVWLKHINITRGSDGEPKISYSPVTITQWQPEVRKY
jgi:succinate dehydrogenase / fumarate reductase flavoprotein subunit